jgi:hypothetical protein
MEQTAQGTAPAARKAIEAWNLCLNTNMQTYQQLTNWWANVIKENVSLYAELQTSTLEAFQEGNAYVARRLSTLPEDIRDPMGASQRTAGEFADSSAKIAKLFQGNAQAVWRSGEQCWLTTQQTGNAIQDQYTRLSDALRTLYSAA